MYDDITPSAGRLLCGSCTRAPGRISLEIFNNKIIKTSIVARYLTEDVQNYNPSAAVNYSTVAFTQGLCRSFFFSKRFDVNTATDLHKRGSDGKKKACLLILIGPYINNTLFSNRNVDTSVHKILAQQISYFYHFKQNFKWFNTQLSK